MDIKQRLTQDLKAAMLSGNKNDALILRGLKSVILYDEVASGNRESGISDQRITELFAKEAKKRQESADLYHQGKNDERASAEIYEKTLIEKYLPQQLTDDELQTITGSVITDIGPVTGQTIGKIIAEIKNRSKGKADGGRIAAIVRAKLLS
ncbi:MAG: GatB/YqeY domain-containing protein [Candidatus Saccharimonadales bacterium]